MSFYASYFIYDSNISYEYGLKISSATNSGIHETSGANVRLFTESLYHRPKVYLLGVQETPTLTIPITISVEDQLTASESSAISKWLFGQNDFKKLQIIQPDMSDLYYNCIFVNPKVIRVGNIIRGYRADIVCDSPFAWEFLEQTTYEYPLEEYLISDTITYNNLTDTEYYSYPIVEVKMNHFGDTFSLINLSDNDREFGFSDLNPDEFITIDNDLQIIDSDTGESRVENFTTYKWFRLLPGLNKLSLTGGVATLRIINQVAKKIA